MPRFARILLVLAALALSAPLLTAADPPKKDVPKALPADVVAAWKKAGFSASWVEVGTGDE